MTLHPPHRAQRGQAMVEYTVVCTALALTLGIGMVNDDSVLWQLVQSFQTAYRHFTYALSLPT
jgi:Flp pilus assembly pilin Flp